MIVIGLTGSIGMGKSTVARMMEDMGIPFNDADAAVHKALGPNGAAVAPIEKLFPAVIEHTDPPNAPYVNRQKLGQIVFNDDEKLKQLEDILHPIAIQSGRDFVAQCRAEGLEFCVLDIPLLFETGGEARVDVTFCVTAAADVQKARVMARPNMTEDKFKNILVRQLPDAEKRARADYIIYTDVSMDETREQIILILDSLRKKHA